MMRTNHKQGIASTLILIIITIFTLSYFKVNLHDLVDTPAVRDNFAYAWNIFVLIVQKIADLVRTIAAAR